MIEVPWKVRLALGAGALAVGGGVATWRVVRRLSQWRAARRAMAQEAHQTLDEHQGPDALMVEAIFSHICRMLGLCVPVTLTIDAEAQALLEVEEHTLVFNPRLMELVTSDASPEVEQAVVTALLGRELSRIKRRHSVPASLRARLGENSGGMDIDWMTGWVLGRAGYEADVVQEVIAHLSNLNESERWRAEQCTRGYEEGFKNR